MSQRTMEMRVGILILLSLALLAGFVVVMGGMSFEPTHVVNVEFDNPGGLKSGAPVKLSGIQVGRVAAIEYRRTDEGAQTAVVRVVAKLDNEYHGAIHKNSQWFISTQGVLGEQFLAVDPGTPDQPPIEDGAVVHGISPPRLDLLLSESYELLHHAYRAVVNNEDRIAETFDGLHKTLRGTGTFFDRNQSKLDAMLDRLDALTVQLSETTEAMRAKYVDNPQIDEIISNTRGATASANQELGPLLREARAMTTALSELSQAFGGPEEVRRYRQIVADVSQVAATSKQMTLQAQSLISHVQAGKGTFGAILMDEALYDDMQEFLRDIKHNPWKVFWKE